MDLSRTAEDIVLSYFDTLVRKVDVQSLQKGNWLTDTIIGFYFEYLQKGKYDYLQNVTAFVSPETTQWLKMTPSVEDVLSVCKALKMSNKLLVFFVVNDEVDVTKAGGTHWSLLMLSRLHGRVQTTSLAYAANQRFYHFDSCHPRNARAARTLAVRVQQALLLDAQRSSTCTVPENDLVKTQYTSSGENTALYELPALMEVSGLPQQRNGFDCGIYALIFAETLIEALAKPVEHALTELEASPCATTTVKNFAAESDARDDQNKNAQNLAGDKQALSVSEPHAPDCSVSFNNNEITALLDTVFKSFVIDEDRCRRKRKEIQDIIVNLREIF